MHRRPDVAAGADGHGVEDVPEHGLDDSGNIEIEARDAALEGFEALTTPLLRHAERLPALGQLGFDLVREGFGLGDLVLTRDGQAVSLSAATLQRLRAYPWPGNIRQLENTLQRLVLLAGEGPITIAVLESDAELRRALLGDAPERYVDAYKFDIRPATDDRPYFSHFFRWRTLPEVMALRKAGGAGLIEWGYLVLVATLAQAAEPVVGPPRGRDRNY